MTSLYKKFLKATGDQIWGDTGIEQNSLMHVTREKKFPMEGNHEMYWNPYSLSYELPPRATAWLSSLMEDSEGQRSPSALSTCSTLRPPGMKWKHHGVSCCHFYSIFYTPPALMYLFFISVSHPTFFLASFYIFTLFIYHSKHLSIF